MKRLLAIIGGLILFIIFSYVNVGIICADLLELKEHAFEIGPEIFRLSHDQPDVMEEEGNMYGVFGSYTYHNIDPTFMLTAEGRFTYGEVDFSSPSSGNMDGIDDYMYELRGLGGYDFFISQTFAITPYIGIGYRYLNDDSFGMTTTKNKKGYERESVYYYSPIGIEFITNLEDGWSVGGIIEYDKFWSGNQKNFLTEVDTDFDDLELDQHNGYGIRGSIKIQKKGKNIGFSIEPFIRYWSVEQSNESKIRYSGVIIGLGYEPKNTTKEIGLNCTIIF